MKHVRSNPEPDRPNPASASVPDWLSVGTHVYDTSTGRTGVVMAIAFQPVEPLPDFRKRAWLRPAGGGVEWTPKISDLRPERRP